MHNLHYKLRGFFTLEVVDAKTKKVVYKTKEKNNLILTQGLGYVALRSFIENIYYCAVGSGITAPLSSDTGLANELQRTGTPDLNLTSACITSLSGNIYSLTKTFQFPTNTFPITFGEIGWSYSSSAGNNLFSKALIVDANGNSNPVVVGAAQYLRVKYTLQVTLSPSTSQAITTSNVTGWASGDGTYCLQYVGLKSILSDGTISYYDAAQDCNEPSSIADVFVGRDSTALAAFGSCINRSTSTYYTTTTQNVNVTNNSLTKTATFGKSNGNDTLLRSVGLGKVGGSAQNSGFVYVYNSAQTKDTNNLLTFNFLYTWG